MNNFDGAQDGVIRDLRKRLSRAKLNAKSAYSVAAAHSRSAENAHFALDEVCNPGLSKQENMGTSNVHSAWGSLTGDCTIVIAGSRPSGRMHACRRRSSRKVCSLTAHCGPSVKGIARRAAEA